MNKYKPHGVAYIMHYEGILHRVDGNEHQVLGVGYCIFIAL